MTNQDYIRRQSEDVHEILRTVKNKFLSLDHDTLNWKESSQQWSILECFEHLNRYNRYYNQTLENAVRKLQGNSVTKVYSTRWIGGLFINMMDPKNTKKQKTLKHLNPTGSDLGVDVLQEFIRHQEHLLQLLKDSKTINLNKRMIGVEFMRFLKLSVGDAYRFVITHEQRHLLQAEKTLQKQNYQRVDLVV